MKTGLEGKSEAELAALHRNGLDMANAMNRPRFPYGGPDSNSMRVWRIAGDALVALVFVETTRRVIGERQSGPKMGPWRVGDVCR